MSQDPLLVSPEGKSRTDAYALPRNTVSLTEGIQSRGQYLHHQWASTTNTELTDAHELTWLHQTGEREPIMKPTPMRMAYVIAALLLLSSCSLVELSGTMTRQTGEVMTDYSKQNDGLIGSAAGVGGRVNTAVGSAVEDVARKGKGIESKDSSAGQFTSANKRVIAAASDAASNKANSENAQVIKAQKRLQQLGYDVGSPDGLVGPRTKSAIGQYQEKVGIPATRIFDKATLSSLGIAENQ